MARKKYKFLSCDLASLNGNKLLELSADFSPKVHLQSIINYCVSFVNFMI